MSADLSFAAGSRPAPPPGFVAAVLRRIGRAQLARGGIIVGAVIVLGSISRLNIGKRYVLDAHFHQSMALVEIVLCCSVMLAMVASDEAVSRGAPRWPTYLLATLAACLVGSASSRFVLLQIGWESSGTPTDPVPAFIGPVMNFLNAWLYGTVACVAYVNRRIAGEAAARMHEAARLRSASRRRTLESRLQAMQARVEPQFLFNTLAQVRDLFEHDAELGGRMLEDLIAYLRAALPHLRESSSTLAQELRLVQAWLDIQRIGLHGAFAFEIQPVDAAVDGRMPPMMLLPIVDHALTSGAVLVGARRAINIAARVADGRLRVTVEDTAGAFAPGVEAPALDGIVQRLQALHGDAARLERAGSDGGGSRIVLEMPYEVPVDRGADPAPPPVH